MLAGKERRRLRGGAQAALSRCMCRGRDRGGLYPVFSGECGVSAWLFWREEWGLVESSSSSSSSYSSYSSISREEFVLPGRATCKLSDPSHFDRTLNPSHSTPHTRSFPSQGHPLHTTAGSMYTVHSSRPCCSAI